MSNEWVVNWTITIQAKDGRFKYTINQISFYAPKMKGMCSSTFYMEEVKNKCLGQSSFYKLKVKIHNEMLTIVEGLENNIKSSDSIEEDDSW